MEQNLIKAQLDIGEDEIKITGGIFEGITFHYGRVALIPDIESDRLKLQFEYTITSEKFPEELGAFEEFLGHVLVQLLEDGVQHNSIVYTGGTD